VEQSVIPTDLSITPKEMIQRMIKEIEKQMKQANIREEELIGIGIGAPGPLDSKKGMISNPPNLHGWVNVPVKEEFAAAFSLPITVENDANAAAVAEKWLGAGQGCNDFVYMTVSTGVGAGVIVDGKLLHGIKGNAGDIGH